MTSRIPSAHFIAIIFLLISFETSASTTHLEAHEHGSANLNIAVDGATLFLGFESPAINIIGFEHAAENDQQTAAINSATTKLKNFEQVFKLPESAGCKPTSATANWISELEEGSNTAGHTEFKAEYQLSCEQIERLAYIDVQLFELFPGIEDLDVQVISVGKQFAIELNPGQQRIELK